MAWLAKHAQRRKQNIAEKQAEMNDEQKAGAAKEETVKLEKSDVDEVAGGARRKPIVTPEI